MGGVKGVVVDELGECFLWGWGCRGWCGGGCPVRWRWRPGRGWWLVMAAPLALVAGHFAPLVPGQGAHRAVGQCADAAGEGARTRSALPAPGEGPPGRGSAWCARPGSPIALAPLLADDQVALPGRRVPPGRQLSGRPPGQPHAHDPGAHNPADGCPLLRVPPPGAARSRAPTRFLPRDGVWIHV